MAPGPQAQGGGWAESDHGEQIAVKYTEKGMSSLAFWVQGGLLERLARGLHLGGRTDIPQMREEMWAPGQRAQVAFHRHGGGGGEDGEEDGIQDSEPRATSQDKRVLISGSHASQTCRLACESVKNAAPWSKAQESAFSSSSWVMPRSWSEEGVETLDYRRWRVNAGPGLGQFSPPGRGVSLEPGSGVP